MAQVKQPKIVTEDLQPKATIAGYRFTWEERGLIGWAELLPVQDQPARGFTLECSYDTVSGREPGNRQIDQGTTLTGKVRELMLGQMAISGWREIGRNDQRRPIWQHSSRITASSASKQDQPAQNEQVSVTVDDFKFNPYHRNYQAIAIQGDVQAVVRFNPMGRSEEYALMTGVDCYPWPPAQPMTQEQRERATAFLLPVLLDQVHTALQVAGWSLERKDIDRDMEIWTHPGRQTARALQVEQDQPAPVPAKKASVGQASRTLLVPAREKVSGYKRTITASDVTYTCARCGDEVTKAVFPGAAPQYCDNCAIEVKREKTRARVQRLRAGKKQAS